MIIVILTTKPWNLSKFNEIWKLNKSDQVSDKHYLNFVSNVSPAIPQGSNYIKKNKMVPMNLIWSKSNQWLLSSSIGKVSRVIMMPMNKPMWPKWANNHDIAHLQVKTIPKNFIWSESAQRLWSNSIHKIWTEGRTDRDYFIVPFTFLWKAAGRKSSLAVEVATNHNHWWIPPTKGQ